MDTGLFAANSTGAPYVGAARRPEDGPGRSSGMACRSLFAILHQWNHWGIDKRRPRAQARTGTGRAHQQQFRRRHHRHASPTNAPTQGGRSRVIRRSSDFGFIAVDSPKPYTRLGITRMLFTDRQRDDASPRRDRESSFAFLDRSSRPEVARVRDLLTAAVANYPQTEQPDLQRRIVCNDDVKFRSATFELLLHEGLRRLGFALTPHPALPNGSAKKPDFLVSTPDGATFYLEAVLAKSRDGADTSAEAIKATTLGALRDAPHHSFLVDVYSNGDPVTQPRSRNLVRQVHEWLNSLDPDLLLHQIGELGLESVPEFRWTHEGWELTLRPIPVQPERRGRTTSLLAALGAEGRWPDEWTPLRDAVEKKGSRYGHVDKPLVVAVNSESFDLDPIDEMQALFGQEEYAEYVGRPELSGRRGHAANGAWNGPRGAQARRVSAAWFFNDLTPYTIGSRRNTVYINPWAHIEAPSSLMQLPNARFIDDRLVRSDGIAVRDMFGVGPDWPE